MNAIIARIGADAGPLRVGLIEAVKHAQWAHDQMVKAALDSAKTQQKAAEETARVQARAAQDAVDAKRRAEKAIADLDADAARQQQARATARDKAMDAGATGADLRGRAVAAGLRTVGDERTTGTRGGHGGGGSKLQAATFAGEALDAITGDQGYVMKLQMLAKVGPAGAAVAGVGIAIIKTVEHLNELKKATEELGKATQTTAVSEQAMAHKREELLKGIDEVDKRRDEGFFQKTSVGMLTKGVVGMFSKKDPELESFAKQRDAQEEILRMDTEIAERVKAQTSARLESAHGSEKEGALMESQLKTEEKLASLRDEAAAGKMGLQEYDERRKLALAEGQIDRENIARKADAADRDLAIQTRLLKVKREGSDVEVQSAEIALSRALGDERTAITTEQKAAAGVAVTAAEDAYHAAKDQRTEMEAQHALSMSIAGLTGTADRKHLASLQLESQFLAEKLARAKDDDKPAIVEQIAANTSAQREAGIAAGAKNYDVANNRIDAGAGRGELEQQRVLAAKIQLERSRYGFMAANDADDAALTGQSAKIAQMQNQFKEMLETRVRINKEATVQTDVMRAELAGHKQIAKALQEQLQFRERMDQAKKDGNEPLQKQLQQQRLLGAQQNAQDAQDAARAAYQPSIGELAGMRGSGRGGIEARQYERTVDRAKRAYGRGDTARGDKLADDAENLRNGLEKRGILAKDDKTKFKDALDAAQVLKDIKTNTGKFGKAI